MAQINPTLPTIGQPNSTEDQDTINALTAIVALVNGGIDTANLKTAAALVDTQLAASPSALWRTVREHSFSATAISAAGTSIPNGTSIQATAGSAFIGVPLWPLDPVTLTGRTQKLRLRVAYAANFVAPGMSFTFGLHQVNLSSGSGTFQLGVNTTAATGSTAVVTTPSSGATGSAVSGDFDVPSAGVGSTLFIPCLAASGAQAANSIVLFTVSLDTRYI